MTIKRSHNISPNTLYEALPHIWLFFKWDYIVIWLAVSVLMQHSNINLASVLHQYHKRFHVLT